ncbi:hypothetical protein [Rubrivivax gelatinosus]|uniref:hypothetical protein n=1 Tax=Rubrivivax gelatinosus TaxID=28068 RepID=UPI0012FE71E6|nr:hypothetical protein [Rubrivivax gelatinosus]MBG6082890.1 hypothetical protein [Rubrivivax gelatinosus]
MEDTDRIPAGPARPTWLQTFALATVVVLLLRLGIARFVPPADVPAANDLAFWVFPALVTLRWMAWLPEGRQRAARTKRSPWVRIAILLIPGEFVGLCRWLVVTAGGCLSWILRRPPPPRPPGRPIEDRRKGVYDGLMVLNLVSFVPEIPITLMLLSSVQGHLLVHVLVHTAEVLAIVLLLGDRWLVRAGGHVLTRTHLDLRVGARAAARLPIEDIAHAERLDKKTSYRAWCRSHGTVLRETGVISVFDDPNLVLSIRPGAALCWTRFQFERPLPRHLFVYVDDPAALIGVLEEAKGSTLDWPGGTRRVA